MSVDLDAVKRQIPHLRASQYYITATMLAELIDEVERLRGVLREFVGSGVSYRARDYNETQISHALLDGAQAMLENQTDERTTE